MRRLLVVSAVLAALVAPSCAAAAKMRFAVSFRAAVSLSWKDTAAYSESCSVTTASTGSEHFVLRSPHRITVTLKTAHGRPATLAGALGLAVEATGGGSTTITTCGQQAIDECTLGPPSFGATVHFARSQPGVIGLTQLSGDGFAPWKRCLPQAFPTSDFPPLSRALGSVNERKLLKRRSTVVSATDNRVTHVVTGGGPAGLGEQGDLTRQVSWKLVFRRLSR